jgi:TPP-dependent indolepyruvate ferredoxin oxidoreductase alpha subunit
MAKLIITIEEKAQSIENNQTMVAFGVTQDMVWEGAEKSLLPSMGPILTELVLKAISLIQQYSGGTLHKADVCDRSIPLESHMAELKAELSQPFSSEL